MLAVVAHHHLQHFDAQPVGERGDDPHVRGGAHVQHRARRVGDAADLAGGGRREAGEGEDDGEGDATHGNLRGQFRTGRRVPPIVGVRVETCEMAFTFAKNLPCC